MIGESRDDNLFDVIAQNLCVLERDRFEVIAYKIILRQNLHDMVPIVLSLDHVHVALKLRFPANQMGLVIGGSYVNVVRENSRELLIDFLSVFARQVHDSRTENENRSAEFLEKLLEQVVSSLRAEQEVLDVSKIQHDRIGLGDIGQDLHLNW